MIDAETPKFKCDSLVGKNCSGEDGDVSCCYYCPHIEKCKEQWIHAFRFCTLLKRGRWCSRVKEFINKFGFYDKDAKEMVVFT